MTPSRIFQRFPFWDIFTRKPPIPLLTMSPEEWQQTRLIGEDDDDERLDSADDEDLDSDAAFDDSDEERFADFFSSQVRYSLYVLEINSYVVSI